MALGTIAAVTGIVGGLYNLGSGISGIFKQKEQEELLKKQRAKQQAYFDSVADDVRRRGDVQKRQLRVSAEQQRGARAFSAARSGVALDGTVQDIETLSQENLETDLETLEQDIQTQIEAARMTGDTSYLQMTTQIANTQTAQSQLIGTTIGRTANLLSTAAEIEEVGFLEWLAA